MRLLLCASTEQVTLAGQRKKARQTKEAERRDKVSICIGKRKGIGRPESFQDAGDVKNAPLAREQKAT
jgi:hypothetical protein